MAERIIKFSRSNTSVSGWNMNTYHKTFMFGSAKSDNLSDIGWNVGQQQNLSVQQMKDGRFCIFKRQVGANDKSGYKVYPSLEAMQEDFELKKDLTYINSRELSKEEVKQYLSEKKLIEDVEYTYDTLTAQVAA